MAEIAMVERIARHMVASWGGDLDDFSSDDRGKMIAAARAAVGAMREPTNKMIHAGLMYPKRAVHLEEMIRDRHRAMMDAALENG